MDKNSKHGSSVNSIESSYFTEIENLKNELKLSKKVKETLENQLSTYHKEADEVAFQYKTKLSSMSALLQQAKLQIGNSYPYTLYRTTRRRYFNS